MITRHGLRECILITALCAMGAAAVFVTLVPLNLIIACVAAGLIGVVWFGLMMFFRNPPRRLPMNLKWGDMVSPADGVVSAVEHVPNHECTDGEPAVIVRIFLSVLNVHVNRAPFDGEVVALRYQPGKFHNAQTTESARENEFNLITIRIETGETIGVRQVSGMLARRIVCPLRVGDRLSRGETFGMIKFGSTTELILPRPNEVEVHVKQGDGVRGKRTILATITRSE